MTQEPSGRTLYPVASANCLGLINESFGAAIFEGSVQGREVYTGATRMPVDYQPIIKVLAENKVSFEELFVKPREAHWLISSYPLGGSQSCPGIR
jgi:hypothetical protein